MNQIVEISPPSSPTIPVRADNAMTPMDMLNTALERGANIETLEKLMGLQERWEASQARKAFDDAMAGAKSEIPVIRKNKQVGFDSKKAGATRTDYMHEDLAQIARTVDPILSKYGLSYRFRTKSGPNEPVSVTCIVSHRLGYSEENTLMAGRDDSGNKNSIQAVGSTITYLQRYTLKAALGLAASQDDDGKTADQTAEQILTDDQIVKLREELALAGSDVQKFCEYYRIEAVPDLPASKFDAAISSIRRAGANRRNAS